MRPQTDREIRLYVLLPLLFQVRYDAYFSHDFMIYMEDSYNNLNSDYEDPPITYYYMASFAMLAPPL